MRANSAAPPAENAALTWSLPEAAHHSGHHLRSRARPRLQIGGGFVAQRHVGGEAVVCEGEDDCAAGAGVRGRDGERGRDVRLARVAGEDLFEQVRETGAARVAGVAADVGSAYELDRIDRINGIGFGEIGRPFLVERKTTAAVRLRARREEIRPVSVRAGHRLFCRSARRSRAGRV